MVKVHGILTPMNEQPKRHELRQRLRNRSREILWALLLTLVALGALAVTLSGA